MKHNKQETHRKVHSTNIKLLNLLALLLIINNSLQRPLIPSQYIFSKIIFVVTKKKLFQLNSQVHNIHTKYNNNLHLLSTGLTVVQKGVAYSGCKIYDHLPSQI